MSGFRWKTNGKSTKWHHPSSDNEDVDFVEKPMGNQRICKFGEAANAGCDFGRFRWKTVSKSTKSVQPSGRIAPSKKLISWGTSLTPKSTKFQWKTLGLSTKSQNVENASLTPESTKFRWKSLGLSTKLQILDGAPLACHFVEKALVKQSKLLNSGKCAAWAGFRCKTNGKSTKSHGPKWGNPPWHFVEKRWNSQRNGRKSAVRNLSPSAWNFVEKALGNQRNRMGSGNWKARHDFVEKPLGLSTKSMKLGAPKSQNEFVEKPLGISTKITFSVIFRRQARLGSYFVNEIRHFVNEIFRWA